uniref:Uncharacterized protein n=1 Tax=Timema shepardi TaxID=629360 RepID=A0A7R9ASQ6_TIMSH|nr:unnamed protein product [Timema shepardi]
MLAGWQPFDLAENFSRSSRNIIVTKRPGCHALFHYGTAYKTGPKFNPSRFRRVGKKGGLKGGESGVGGMERGFCRSPRELEASRTIQVEETTTKRTVLHLPVKAKMATREENKLLLLLLLRKKKRSGHQSKRWCLPTHDHIQTTLCLLEDAHRYVAQATKMRQRELDLSMHL